MILEAGAALEGILGNNPITAVSNTGGLARNTGLDVLAATGLNVCSDHLKTMAAGAITSTTQFAMAASGATKSAVADQNIPPPTPTTQPNTYS